MLAAVIENGSTWLLDIRDDVEISAEELRKQWRKRYVGWLVNTDSMPEIIWGMPISRFLVKLSNGDLSDVSIKQAHSWLQEIVELRQQEKKL